MKPNMNVSKARYQGFRRVSIQVLPCEFSPLAQEGSNELPSKRAVVMHTVMKVVEDRQLDLQVVCSTTLERIFGIALVRQIFQGYLKTSPG
jgi:hypothetical protein